jgi:hypothetical protein
MRASIIFGAVLLSTIGQADGSAWRLPETPAAFHLVGNQSSNSSSNSSNGVHTRVDTYQSDDGRGRRFYQRRVYERFEEPPRRARRWRGPRGDDD